MMKPTRLATLYLSVVFLAGALFGFAAHSFYTQRPARASSPKEFRERYVSRLQKELSLAPEQVTQLTAILDQTSEQFREMRQKMDPEFAAIREAQRQHIMAMLTPEQQPKYQKIIEEYRRRHQKQDRPGGPPPR